MHVDHGLADAGAGELVEHVVEQRLAGDADQRLWHVVGEGAHAHTETGGKNQSAVHWDMICDLRKGGRITADGELIAQDGRFVR